MAGNPILVTEITTDPLGRGYAGMTDQQVADSLNTVNRTRNRKTMSGDEVFNAIDSRSTWDALLPASKELFVAFCARDIIDPFALANVELVKSIFGNTSATVSNLASRRVENVSRGVELGFGKVGEGDVWDVRNG